LPSVFLVSGSRREATCRGCGADIAWFKTPGGKAMPMNRGAQPIARPLGGNTTAEYSTDDTHWATCPQRDQFKRRRG
jgi:hypothetical protein